MPCMHCCSLWLAPVCILWPIVVEVHHWYETRKSSDEGQIIEALRGQSPLHETKSSNKGQIIETPGGRSPLHETKSSNKGQTIETLGGQSPLHETKSSNEGHPLRPHGQWHTPTRGIVVRPHGQWRSCHLRFLLLIVQRISIFHSLLLFNIWVQHLISLISTSSTAWVLLPPTTPNSTPSKATSPVL